MAPTATRYILVADKGRVANAAHILVTRSTLAEHVTLTDSDWATTIEPIPGGVPFDYWGSGTQALWSLLCAMVYSGETVSLYQVAARCDGPNRAAVADALGELLR